MKTKKQKGAFQKKLEHITYARIMNMTMLESDIKKKIRFLHDDRDRNNKTNMYVVFDGRINHTYYARSYQQAEKRYQYLLTNT